MLRVFTDTDFQQLSQFDGHELLRLYRFLIQRLPGRSMDAVMTVRLPPDVVERIREIAVRRRSTRSEVARTAIIEYAQRNPA